MKVYYFLISGRCKHITASKSPVNFLIILQTLTKLFSNKASDAESANFISFVLKYNIEYINNLVSIQLKYEVPKMRR